MRIWVGMFSLLNVKWGEPTFGTPSGQITWSSELNGDLPIAPGFDLEDIEAALRSAFNAWENVSAVDFVEVASGGSVSIANDALEAPVVALTGPFPVNPVSLFTMTSAEVIFSNTLGEEINWSPFGGSGTVDFFAVAAHEIGHIIGLDHPGDPEQIMNAIIQVDEFGLGDIQGAQFLYGTDGDDVEVEPGTPVNAAALGLAEGDSGGGGGGGGGLILGLIALIAAFFTGGASLAFAAAQFGRLNEDEADELADADGPIEMDPLDVAAIFNSFEGCDHGHHVETADGLYHGVTVAELLPQIDFTQQPNPCGCTGLCEHIIDMDDGIDETLL